MKTYRITSIMLMITCTALLIHSNYQKNRNAEIVDQYFDLQAEYEKIFDDVQELEQYSERLEEQVDILSNFISPADWIEIDSIDTTIE
jgi:predicted nuclease with TOPRIM domain